MAKYSRDIIKDFRATGSEEIIANKHLNGLRVLNTRPKEDSVDLSNEIKKAGGIAIELPCINIIPTTSLWLNKTNNWHNIEQAIFISKNAVRNFYKTLSKQNIIFPQHIKITAIGNSSAKILQDFHQTVNFISKYANSESLLELENLQHVMNQNILLIKGIGGREVITTGLLSRGANVIELAVYQRVLPTNFNKDLINSIWQEKKVDIIIFTSGDAMKNIFSLFPSNAKTWILNTPCVVISERLRKKALMLGIKKVILTSYNEIIEALQGYKND